VKRSHVLTAVGVVLALLGTLFTLQGVGLLGGSPMTGSTSWATLGPIVVLVGLCLVILRDAERRR